jgi:hypothetical protein
MQYAQPSIKAKQMSQNTILSKAISHSNTSMPFPTKAKINSFEKDSLYTSFYNKDNYFYTSQSSSQRQNAALDIEELKNDYLSCIKDPLWKHICGEILNLMGPTAFRITKAQLGVYSAQDKTLDLFCHTEELSQFLNHYHFVIFGSLRRYFPYLKELKVKHKMH